MRYYQFPTKQAYLQEKKRIVRNKSKGQARDYIGILSAVFGTVTGIEEPIQTNCLFLRFDNDFYFSDLCGEFRRRPEGKERFRNPPPVDTRIYAHYGG